MCECEVVDGFEDESGIEFSEEEAEAHQPRIDDSHGLE